jgi:hypothetical protein
LSSYVHVVLQFEGDGTSEVVGVFTTAALAKRVAARKAHRVVYTCPMDRELGKAKA